LGLLMCHIPAKSHRASHQPKPKCCHQPYEFFLRSIFSIVSIVASLSRLDFGLDGISPNSPNARVLTSVNSILESDCTHPKTVIYPKCVVRVRISQFGGRNDLKSRGEARGPTCSSNLSDLSDFCSLRDYLSDLSDWFESEWVE
jgi:hypothetical protein